MEGELSAGGGRKGLQIVSRFWRKCISTKKGYIVTVSEEWHQTSLGLALGKTSPVREG